jgi:methionyl-tRNA formyltransferase
VGLLSENRKRVVFFGNGYDYSLAFLHTVAVLPVDLIAIVCPTPDKERRGWAARARRLALQLPSGMGRSLRARLTGEFPAEVVRVAHETGAQVFWPSTVNDHCFVEELELLDPDVVVMAGFSEILAPVVLERLSPILNVHPSVLPLHRGPHPEFWTVRSGDAEAGVTIHLVDHGVDTGPIVGQERFLLEPWLTGGQLQARAIRIGCKLLGQILSEPGTVKALPSWPQDGEGSYDGRIEGSDLVLPFESDATAAYNLARAASPWLQVRTFAPRRWWLGAHMSSSGALAMGPAPDLMRLTLRRPGLFPDTDGGTPGTIRRMEGGTVAIACNPGVVVFEEVVG